MIAIWPRDLLLLLEITLVRGLNLITSKVGVDEIPPALFTFLRFAIVAAIALAFAGVAIRGFDPQIGERWESLAATGSVRGSRSGARAR